MYKKIGVAVAFSPRCEAIVAEAARLQQLFNAQLYFIHVGKTSASEMQYLKDVIRDSEVKHNNIKMIWEKGFAASKILTVCKREGLELLLLGALRKENILKFYIGSIARNVLRRANCSVFTMISPSIPPKEIRRVVINATEGVNYQDTISTGIEWAKLEGAEQVVIFKAIKLFGLSMAIKGEEGSEKSYEEARRKIVSEAYEETEALLSDIDSGNLRVHIKIAAGKPGRFRCSGLAPAMAGLSRMTLLQR